MEILVFLLLLLLLLIIIPSPSSSFSDENERRRLLPSPVQLTTGLNSHPNSNVIKIGALFTEEEKDSQSELAFKYAVYRINRDRTILPNATLLYDIQYIPIGDSFHASKKACYQISNGVVAIFGPQDPFLGVHVQSLCDALDIPHLECRLQHLGEGTASKEFSINLHPGSKAISDSLRDLIIYLNWTKVAIIYEDDLSLIGLQELVKPPPLPKNVQFIFRKSSQASFRETLQDLKSRNIYSMIIDVKPDSLPYLLTSVLQVQMNDYKYHYHFTTFDIEIFDLENFKYNFVNMTAFRIVDSTNPMVRHILSDIERFQPSGYSILNKTYVIQAGTALMFDSVLAFAKGVDLLRKSSSSSFYSHPASSSSSSSSIPSYGSSLYSSNSYTSSSSSSSSFSSSSSSGSSTSSISSSTSPSSSSSLLRASNASCEHEIPWLDGTSLYNYINTVGFHGLSGKVQFKEGIRSTIKWDLLKLRQTDLDKVGEWTNTGGLNVTKPEAFHEFGGTNITLKVTTIEVQPYIMRKKGTNHTGNEQYEGFCIDLLQTIANSLGFHYELYLVPDNKFGAEDSDGKWSGLVRQLIDRDADLAVAPMTITYTRESVIDFTKPFMNLGIGILFKIPTNMPTRLFSFMSPLAFDIWIYVLLAYIVVSATLFIVARFSPYEWTNPHPCVTESDIVSNQFSLANSFWFTVVTLMKQGCDLNPKAISTRIIGAIWWFFTLILISSYTANLAAFLTVERMITPIENVEDLAAQSKILYGALEGGSTMTFFRDSKIPTYQKMWKFMETYEDKVFAKSYEDGTNRVLAGNYAFLMESTMLDYMVQRNCNLTQVGGLLDSKGYGIATPMGSPWRDRISLAILDLQEKGIIQMLYDKWWKSPGLTCIRDELTKKDGKAAALGADNIGGVFVVLLFGLAFAVLTAMFEFFWHSRKLAKNSRLSYCTEMAEELKFAVKCRASTRRPVFKRRCSPCIMNQGLSYPTPGILFSPSSGNIHTCSHTHNLHPHPQLLDRFPSADSSPTYAQNGSKMFNHSHHFHHNNLGPNNLLPNVFPSSFHYTESSSPMNAHMYSLNRSKSVGANPRIEGIGIQNEYSNREHYNHIPHSTHIPDFNLEND